jgi:hypothetical protein
VHSLFFDRPLSYLATHRRSLDELTWSIPKLLMSHYFHQFANDPPLCSMNRNLSIAALFEAFAGKRAKIHFADQWKLQTDPRKGRDKVGKESIKRNPKLLSGRSVRSVAKGQI